MALRESLTLDGTVLVPSNFTIQDGSNNAELFNTLLELLFFDLRLPINQTIKNSVIELLKLKSPDPNFISERAIVEFTNNLSSLYQSQTCLLYTSPSPRDS